MIPLNDRSLLPASGRIIALDPGKKTIGISVSDVEQTMATPITTIQRKKLMYDLEQLQSLIKEHHAAGIVIGYPLNADGTDGPRCQSVRAFARELEKVTELPIVFWDERYSSAAATDALAEAQASHRIQRDVIDAHAAAVILQQMLDA